MQDIVFERATRRRSASWTMPLASVYPSDDHRDGHRHHQRPRRHPVQTSTTLVLRRYRRPARRTWWAAGHAHERRRVAAPTDSGPDLRRRSQRVSCHTSAAVPSGSYRPTNYAPRRRSVCAAGASVHRQRRRSRSSTAATPRATGGCSSSTTWASYSAGHLRRLVARPSRCVSAPYPSPITVTGLPTRVTDLNVVARRVTHTFAVRPRPPARRSGRSAGHDHE